MSMSVGGYRTIGIIFLLVSMGNTKRRGLMMTRIFLAAVNMTDPLMLVQGKGIRQQPGLR